MNVCTLLICSTLVLAAGGKDPKAPITAALYPDADDEILSSMSTIEASFRTEQAQLKADCLRRDGYRCTLTGKVDGGSRDKVPGYIGTMLITHCAHILPFALRKFDERNVQRGKAPHYVPPF